MSHSKYPHNIYNIICVHTHIHTQGHTLITYIYGKLLQLHRFLLFYFCFLFFFKQVVTHAGYGISGARGQAIATAEAMLCSYVVSHKGSLIAVLLLFFYSISQLLHCCFYFRRCLITYAYYKGNLFTGQYKSSSGEIDDFILLSFLSNNLNFINQQDNINFFCLFCFLMSHVWHMEVPGQGLN